METVAEVLRAALEFEGQGREFYLQGADRVSDRVVKSVLVALARDEEAHAAVISRFYDALERHQGWPAADADLLAPGPARQRIERILEETAATIGPDATFRSVYERARELELQSRDFYRAQADAAQDHELIRFFRFVAGVEQTHVEVLDSLLEATDRAAGPRASA